MALILCPKCKAEISSLSLACPACGTSLTANSGIFSPNVERRPAQSQPFFENFWGILTAPQTTFQQILDGPRAQGVWAMLFLTAFFDCLGDAMKKGELWHLLLFPLMALICYPLFMLIAWVFTFTGKWIDGKGDLWELFDYLIWSSAAGVVNGIIDIIRNLNYSGLWRFGWGTVEFVVGVWGFIISLFLLAAAHRFSMWLAFLNMILVLVVMLLPLGALLLLIRALVS